MQRAPKYSMFQVDPVKLARKCPKVVVSAIQPGLVSLSETFQLIRLHHGNLLKVA
jgi:hypothetical protein